MPALASFTKEVPTTPGFYHVRYDGGVVNKILIYAHGMSLWVHRPDERVLDMPFIARAFDGCEWMPLPPEWIENGPHSPSVSVGDCVMFPDQSGKGRLSGYVIERGPGWLKIAYGPTIPTSSVMKFIPRHGALIPAGTVSLPTNHF